MWAWDRAVEATYTELVTTGPEHVGKMIGALRGFLGPNVMMAYLVMMAARLVELHRVLKPTGSLYLHWDQFQWWALSLVNAMPVGGSEKKGAQMGLLITLDPPTGPMRTEAVEARFFHSPGFGRDFPGEQIATVEELMGVAQPQIPYRQTTFAKAGRVRRASV